MSSTLTKRSGLETMRASKAKRIYNKKKRIKAKLIEKKIKKIGVKNYGFNRWID